MININESSAMPAYRPIIHNKINNIQTGDTENVSRSLPALNPSLSEEEKEQKLGAVDNGVKTIDAINRNSKPASEQIKFFSTIDELIRFTEELFESESSKSAPPPLENACTIGMEGMVLAAIEPPESTPDNPIMYVTAGYTTDPNLARTLYKVDVNKVNPNSATIEEIFALITYENKHDEQGLVKATWALHDLYVLGVDKGSINFMKDLRDAFTLAARAYKSGDTREKDNYEGLLNMADNLDKRADKADK